MLSYLLAFTMATTNPNNVTTPSPPQTVYQTYTLPVLATLTVSVVGGIGATAFGITKYASSKATEDVCAKLIEESQSVCKQWIEQSEQKLILVLQGQNPYISDLQSEHRGFKEALNRAESNLDTKIGHTVTDISYLRKELEQQDKVYQMQLDSMSRETSRNTTDINDLRVALASMQSTMTSMQTTMTNMQDGIIRIERYIAKLD